MMLNKIKQSKIASYSVIIFMYAIAFIVGLFVFSLNRSGQDLLYLFYADVAATIVIWLFGIWFSNSSIYDPYWSVAPPVILTLLALYWGVFSFSALLLLIAVWFWAIRLTVNWIYTFPNLLHQDWRYTKFRDENPRIWQLINLTGIHLIPTVVVFLAMIPAFYVIQINADANLYTWLSFALCISAVLLQLFSDIQMHRFRRHHKGKICNVGLWNYSRHPNYLGEILFWWGIYFILLSVNPTYWWTIIGPLSNNALFLFISIPLMEKRQIVNKPEYSDYINATSKLLLTIKRKKG